MVRNAQADELGFKLRPVGASRWLTRGPGEDKLSDWMSRNACVTWTEHPEPWPVEEKLICGENSALTVRARRRENDRGLTAKRTDGARDAK